MNKIRLILYVFVVGFLLNLIWENAQAPLYEGYTNLWDHFMLCFWASLGDAAVVLLLFGLLAIWYKDFYWIKDINWKSASVLFLLGGGIAIGFELWAFKNNMWSYKNNMPVIFLDVGLFPLLQMMLLHLLSFCITWMILKNKLESENGSNNTL